MTDNAPRYVIEKPFTKVVNVRMQPDGMDWCQWFLLRSDAHHDNLHCDQALEKKHLDQALERDAGIIDCGDLFCAMGGKFDKRADSNQLRPELRTACYFDALVEYNAKFYEPYARNFVMLSPGNHETAIEKNHETRLTERLAERLKAAGSPVQCGTYQGWVRFMFNFHTTKRKTIRMAYTHGYGGGGPVTKDIIQFNRQLAYLESADLIVSGHTHDALESTQRREYLDFNGKPCYRDVNCIKLGCYKDEFGPGQGWAVGKGMPPKPLGAYWLRFYLGDQDGEITILHEVIRAK